MYVGLKHRPNAFIDDRRLEIDRRFDYSDDFYIDKKILCCHSVNTFTITQY